MDRMCDYRRRWQQGGMLRMSMSCWCQRFVFVSVGVWDELARMLSWSGCLPGRRGQSIYKRSLGKITACWMKALLSSLLQLHYAKDCAFTIRSLSGLYNALFLSISPCRRLWRTLDSRITKPRITYPISQRFVASTISASRHELLQGAASTGTCNVALSLLARTKGLEVPNIPHNLLALLPQAIQLLLDSLQLLQLSLITGS